MPQLDKFAFAPQVFWLVLVFFVVYLLVLKNGLAVLYRVLSFRKKSIQLLNLDVARFVVEATFLTSFTTLVYRLGGVSYQHPPSCAPVHGKKQRVPNPIFYQL